MSREFQALLAQWPADRLAGAVARATPAHVRQALQNAGAYAVRPADFLTLLSPAAATMLEEMAAVANAVTIRNFGRAVNIFTPLYISDICTNHCLYCGFSARNKQKRRHLRLAEAQAEAFAIADRGFRHILLLTGDAPRISTPQYIAEVAGAIRPRFSSIGIEVYSMSQEDYGLLAAAGVDSMTMFQETYDPDLYARLHPKGPKSDYAFRLGAPERAARAGMRSIGLGALLGLNEFVPDAFATGLHAWWLWRAFPELELSVSIPRMCAHEGEFEAEHPVSDRQLAQYVMALRCFLPRAGITCSSRESAFMRNHLLPLGVTRVSAGVSTAVGGRATPDLHNPGQFEISDSRSLAQMMADLKALGYQPVLKDWEDPAVSASETAAARLLN